MLLVLCDCNVLHPTSDTNRRRGRSKCGTSGGRFSTQWKRWVPTLYSYHLDSPTCYSILTWMLLSLLPILSETPGFSCLTVWRIVSLAVQSAAGSAGLWEEVSADPRGAERGPVGAAQDKHTAAVQLSEREGVGWQVRCSAEAKRQMEIDTMWMLQHRLPLHGFIYYPLYLVHGIITVECFVCQWIWTLPINLFLDLWSCALKLWNFTF